MLCVYVGGVGGGEAEGAEVEWSRRGSGRQRMGGRSSRMSRRSWKDVLGAAQMKPCSSFFLHLFLSHFYLF